MTKSFNVVWCGVILEDWTSAIIVPLYKVKVKVKVKCKRYGDISLLNRVETILCGILVGRFCRVTQGLINDEEGVGGKFFKARRGCVNQIFTLKQLGGTQEKRLNYL